MEKAVKKKKLWRGVFSYRNTVPVLYRKAYTERQAWAVMCRYMAKKDGVSVSTVMGLFDGTRDNYKIEIEMEVVDA